MSDDISRRRLIRHASMGAAAAGVAAAGGLSVFSAAGAADAASRPQSSDGPVLDGSGVIAHVVDARTGEISILAGTREIKYINREMAQQLLRAAR